MKLRLTTTALIAAFGLAAFAAAPQASLAADDTGNAAPAQDQGTQQDQGMPPSGNTSQTDQTQGSMSNGQRVDINTASKDDLMTLPGLTDDDAQKIIDNRPYKTNYELVKKKVLPRREYLKIRKHITSKPGMTNEPSNTPSNEPGNPSGQNPNPQPGGGYSP